MLLISCILLFGYIGCSWDNQSKGNLLDRTVAVSQPAVELKTNMRKLWEDHVIWTRNVILCYVDGLPGSDQSIGRLLQNQVDIGEAIKPYYGEEAGEQLTQLLYPHITISIEVIKAAKAKNPVALAAASKRWHQNANDIALFLSESNPAWSLDDMQMMMEDHLRLTTDEVQERINKDYEADVVAYEEAHKGVLAMADMLSEGIINQFPEKFELEIAYSK